MRARVPLAQRFARAMLRVAERAYLRLHGWSRVGEDAWAAPAGYPKFYVGIAQGHAVNSQKKYVADDERWARWGLS